MRTPTKGARRAARAAAAAAVILACAGGAAAAGSSGRGMTVTAADAIAGQTTVVLASTTDQIAWAVSGNESSGTYIYGSEGDALGYLHISSSETASEVTVTAVSVSDPSVSASAAVTVAAADTGTTDDDEEDGSVSVTITGPESGSPGDELTFAASADGASGTITWGISGATDSVITSGGVLTIGEDETADSIRVIASLSSDLSAYAVSTVEIVHDESTDGGAAGTDETEAAETENTEDTESADETEDTEESTDTGHVVSLTFAAAGDASALSGDYMDELLSEIDAAVTAYAQAESSEETADTGPDETADAEEGTADTDSAAAGTAAESADTAETDTDDAGSESDNSSSESADSGGGAEETQAVSGTAETGDASMLGLAAAMAVMMMLAAASICEEKRRAEAVSGTHVRKEREEEA